MKFSIIIPIYNAQKTLRRCLDSILQQTYPSFEVLMIDDGSHDNSAEIASAYAKDDLRLTLVRQANAGPSAARNHGLDMAKGDVVSFVDSDDYLEPDYLERLHDVFQKEAAQVVFFGVNQISESAEKKEVRNIPELPQSYVEQLVALTKADLFGYTWIKAISRQTIGTTRFREDMNLFEDEVFTCEIMQKKPAIAWVGKPLYNQVVQTGSLSRRTHPDYYKKCEAVYLAWKQLLASNLMQEHSILQEKANHMALICKYYLLERDVSPISFAQGLSGCTFFQDATVNDALLSRKTAAILTKCAIYRTKTYLRKLVGR